MQTNAHFKGETSSNATTVDDDSRLDIKVTGLWKNSFVRAFFDVKIFNPRIKLCPKSLPDAHNYHESIENAKYEQRVISVEHSTFNPLIFACTGGAGPTATRALKQVAAKIREKRSEPYADVRCRYSNKRSVLLLLEATSSASDDVGRCEKNERTENSAIYEGRLNGF